ncbi:hypothetical protein GCM10023116_18690 [Kistimonas scapharcae]|uniref:Uncharacterized protein n=2 Tax=Kistimonas scapharcae TaxID=1036133 RepID=A0ABP8V3H2_9GAMM
MAKTQQEKIVDAFKALVSKTAEMRVNGIQVSKGSASCIGGFELTLDLVDGSQHVITDQSLQTMTHDKGDFNVQVVTGKGKDKLTDDLVINFYVMKKEVPRHL